MKTVWPIHRQNLYHISAFDEDTRGHISTSVHADTPEEAIRSFRRGKCGITGEAYDKPTMHVSAELGAEAGSGWLVRLPRPDGVRWLGRVEESNHGKRTTANRGEAEPFYIKAVAEQNAFDFAGELVERTHEDVEAHYQYWISGGVQSDL